MTAGPDSRAYDPGIIREDFDRIAQTPDKEWDHNRHYHHYLLRRIPRRMGRALDIGCGKGEFTRRLAGRAEWVEGIDLSPEMIAEAEKRSPGADNIKYEIADIQEKKLPSEQYGCIASIAAFHHLPMADTLLRIKESMAPGAVLAVLDLYDGRTPLGILYSLAAFPFNVLYRLCKTGRIREGHTEAWRIHSGHEAFLKLHEIRRVCRAILPGVRVKRHLFWRYSIIWKKPGEKN